MQMMTREDAAALGLEVPPPPPLVETAPGVYHEAPQVLADPALLDDAIDTMMAKVGAHVAAALAVVAEVSGQLQPHRIAPEATVRLALTALRSTKYPGGPYQADVRLVDPEGT